MVSVCTLSIDDKKTRDKGLKFFIINPSKVSGATFVKGFPVTYQVYYGYSEVEVRIIIEMRPIMENFFFFFFNRIFYQLLRVQHSCSFTQSWGSVPPSIVEKRDDNSRGCPLLFSNRNLGSFCA